MENYFGGQSLLLESWGEKPLARFSTLWTRVTKGIGHKIGPDLPKSTNSGPKMCRTAVSSHAINFDILLSYSTPYQYISYVKKKCDDSWSDEVRNYTARGRRKRTSPRTEKKSSRNIKGGSLYNFEPRFLPVPPIIIIFQASLSVRRHSIGR